MNDEELDALWTAVDPTARQLRRIDAAVFSWLDAHDTPLAAEWLGLVRVAPFSAAGLAMVSAVSVVGAAPLVWLVQVVL